MFQRAVVDTHVTTHVVDLHRRHPDVGHSTLLHLPLRPASPLPLPPQLGRGARRRCIVMAMQLQPPPLGNDYVWPAGGDDWLAPHWNRARTTVWLTYAVDLDAIFKGGSRSSTDGGKKNKKTAALSEANVDELVAPGRTARKRWKSIKNKKK